MAEKWFYKELFAVTYSFGTWDTFGVYPETWIIFAFSIRVGKCMEYNAQEIFSEVMILPRIKKS